MMIRDKNNIFERVGNFHAEMAWNYPDGGCEHRMQVISAGQLLEWLADLLLDLREGDQASRPDFQVYWLAVVLPERGHESEHYLDSKLE